MPDAPFSALLGAALSVAVWGWANLPYALFLTLVALAPAVLVVRRHPWSAAHLAMAALLGTLFGLVLPLFAAFEAPPNADGQSVIMMVMFFPLFAGPLFGLAALTSLALAELTLRHVRGQAAAR